MNLYNQEEVDRINKAKETNDKMEEFFNDKRAEWNKNVEPLFKVLSLDLSNPSNSKNLLEAQSIAIALEKEIRPPRPLTHDLFKNFAERFDIVIKQVIIHKLVDGVFYSSMICERDKIEEIIDARTSDAIALALRFNAPIFTYKNILS